MADTKAIAKLLKTVPFLSGLSSAAAHALSRRARERAFKAGRLVFREGARGATLYIIQNGAVDIVKGRGKDEVTLATRHAGEFFGEMSILEGTRRSAAARAGTDATLIEVPGDVVLHTLMKNPKVLLETARHLSSNLRRSDTTMIHNLKKKNAELRRAYKALQAAQAEIIEKERLERELELARDLQDSLLPRDMPPMEDFEFAAHSRPAEAVGGDFYDVSPIGPNYFGLLIASVTGKGMFAAIFMALTRALVVSEGQRQLQPKIVAANVHRLLLQLAKPTMPVSLFYGIMHSRDRTMTYVNAGHAAPLLRHPDGSIEALPGEGTQLAASLRMEAEERSITLKPGQTLVLYTGGLTDTTNAAGQPFGLGGLKAALAGAPAEPAGLVDSIFAAVDEHRGAHGARIDQAVLAARVKG